jgi:adenylate cyclase
MGTAQHEKPTILVVDDEIEILRILGRTLGNDYHVLTAQSAKEALGLLNNSVQIILSDQRMPEMDGAALLKAARVKYPNSVRMMMSGYSDIDALIRSVNDGEIFYFIKKPWDLPVLRRTLEAAVEKYEQNRASENLAIENKRMAERDLELSYQLARTLAEIEAAKGDIAPGLDKK